MYASRLGFTLQAEVSGAWSMSCWTPVMGHTGLNKPCVCRTGVGNHTWAQYRATLPSVSEVKVTWSYIWNEAQVVQIYL